MEESIGMVEYLKEQFHLKEVDIKTYSPLALAYIGDGVYDLVIRSIIMNRGNCPVNKLHRLTSHLVKAQTQAEMIVALQGELTEEEMTIYKRGRNAKSFTTAKNASVTDYRKATGFEALMGYLYLENKMERMIDLIKSGLGKIGELKDEI